MGDYIIIGDTEKYKGCLVCVCGTKQRAEECLARMLAKPTANDKRLMEGHSNLRIEGVPKKNCWWHGNLD